MTELANYSLQSNGIIKIGARIREQRKKLKLTLKELAGMSGLSTGFISLVERELSTPSLSALFNIAQALQLDLSVLLSMPKGEGDVTRASEELFFSVNNSQLEYKRHSTEFTDQVLNATEIKIPGNFKSEHIAHRGEEFIYVLEGRLIQQIGDETYILGVGDSAHFQSTLTHNYSNPDSTISRILCVGDLPIFSNNKDAK